MSEYLGDSFRRQSVEEIVAELQMEEHDLVTVLVQMRPTASHALREHLKIVTGEVQRKEIGQVDQPQSRARFFRQLVLRAAVVATTLSIIIFLLLTAVPAARATFGRFVQQRFGLVLVDPSPEAEPTEETELAEGETLTEVAVTIPPISLEEAQEQVDFPIPLPMLLPEGFELWAARVGAGPGSESMNEDGNRIVTGFPVQVILFFKPDKSNQPLYHPDATLGLDIFDQTSLEGGYGVTAGSEESAEVSGNPAVFVKGTWMKVDDGQPPSDDNIIWDETADAAKLSWEADGFTFILSGSHLKLSREDYIRIAESIRQIG